MTPKSTLVFLLLFSLLAQSLGNTSKNRYIHQDSGDIDTDCTADDIDKNFVAAYPQCANNPGLENNVEFEDALRNLFCDKNCGTQYLSSYFATCPYKETLEIIGYYMEQCKVDAAGRPRYSYYKNSMLDMDEEIALQLCKSSIKYNMCSPKCSSQLRAISTHYGSCIGPLFNNSYFHSFDYELLPLFSYQLWTNCGVPIPTPATRAGRAKMNKIMYYYY